MSKKWLAPKENVTHEELDLWGGEIMRQMDEIRDDVKDIKERMLTKDQALEIFLTKAEARELFLTKEEARAFATKKDLERFATKDDIERLFLILDEIRENTKK